MKQSMYSVKHGVPMHNKHPVNVNCYCIIDKSLPKLRNSLSQFGPFLHLDFHSS